MALTRYRSSRSLFSSFVSWILLLSPEIKTRYRFTKKDCTFFNQSQKHFTSHSRRGFWGVVKRDLKKCNQRFLRSGRYPRGRPPKPLWIKSKANQKNWKSHSRYIFTCIEIVRNLWSWSKEEKLDLLTSLSGATTIRENSSSDLWVSQILIMPTTFASSNDAYLPK